MKFWVLLAVFLLGAQIGRWDAKYGRYYGEKFGRYTRVHILKLPPLEKDHD